MCCLARLLLFAVSLCCVAIANAGSLIAQWSYREPPEHINVLTVDEDTCYLALESKVVCLNIENGKTPLWRHVLTSPYRFEVDAANFVLANSAQTTKNDAIVFLVGNRTAPLTYSSTTLHVLNKNTGRVLWRLEFLPDKQQQTLFPDHSMSPCTDPNVCFRWFYFVLVVCLLFACLLFVGLFAFVWCRFVCVWHCVVCFLCQLFCLCFHVFVCD